MTHIDGIGGVFLYSNHPKQLAEWYKNVLDINLKPLEGNIYYIELYSRSLTNPDKKLNTVFAVMPDEEKICSTRNQAMVNFRVDDLEKLVLDIKQKRVQVDPIHEGEDAEGIGKFTHLMDLEGNKIELWQPANGI